jgi:hypothetical protein
MPPASPGPSDAQKDQLVQTLPSGLSTSWALYSSRCRVSVYRVGELRKDQEGDFSGELTSSFDNRQGRNVYEFLAIRTDDTTRCFRC